MDSSDSSTGRVRGRALVFASVVAVGAAGFYVMTSGSDRTPPGDAGFSPGHAYEVLRTTPFDDSYTPRPFVFEDVGGTLPPVEARARGLWLVYAGFSGPGDRARVAFQAFRSEDRASDFAATFYPDTCSRSGPSWECARAHGYVVIEGEIHCDTGCPRQRAHARALLRAGEEHFRRLFD